MMLFAVAPIHTMTPSPTMHEDVQYAHDESANTQCIHNSDECWRGTVAFDTLMKVKEEGKRGRAGLAGGVEGGSCQDT